MAAGPAPIPTPWSRPQGATSARSRPHRQYLASQIAEQNSKMAEIDRQTAQKEAERAT